MTYISYNNYHLDCVVAIINQYEFESIVENSLIGFEIEEQHYLVANLISIPMSFFEVSGWHDGPSNATKYKKYNIKKEFLGEFSKFSYNDMFLIKKYIYRCFIIKHDNFCILRIRKNGAFIENKYNNIETAMFVADHMHFD